MIPETLIEMGFQARANRERHDYASHVAIVIHRRLGILIIGIAIMVGLSIFVFLASEHQRSFVLIGAAISSFIAAIVAAIQTYWNRPTEMCGHAIAGSRYFKITCEIEELIRDRSRANEKRSYFEADARAIGEDLVEIKISSPDPQEYESLGRALEISASGLEPKAP